MSPNHAPALEHARSAGSRLPVARSGSRPHRPRRWPQLLAFALGLALAGGGAYHLAAQQRPSIVAPPTIQAEPASQASLGIRVHPAGSAPSNSFVRVRGFPSSVSLTEGHAIAPGAWAVPLFGLPTLKAIVPAGVSGRAEIVITLVDVDGNTLAQTTSALIIASVTPEKTAEPPRALPPVASPTAPVLPPKRLPPEAPSLPPDVKAQAERMLAIATEKLEQGNIGAARAFLQRAADAGLAEAALKLGATFDPGELAREYPMALSSADAKEARKWYEKARELGAPEADLRLSRLGRR